MQDTIGKIEDELREEMAMSLGRTGLKMKFSMQQINEAKSLVDKVFSDTCSTEDDKLNLSNCSMKRENSLVKLE